MRTTRLHQSHYLPQSHLGCTNAFHMAARDIGYLVDDLVDERGQVLGAKPSAVLAIQGTRFVFVSVGILVFAQADISETPVVVGQEVVRVRLNGLDDVGSWNIVNSFF